MEKIRDIGSIKKNTKAHKIEIERDNNTIVWFKCSLPSFPIIEFDGPLLFNKLEKEDEPEAKKISYV